jgi:hypothetical protein
MCMSHPSLTRQAVALRICHTRHSHGRRCVTNLSHSSLIRQAVRYVYVTPITHTAGGGVTYMSHPSLTRQAVLYLYVTSVTHTAGGALHICHTHHSDHFYFLMVYNPAPHFVQDPPPFDAHLRRYISRIAQSGGCCLVNARG